MNFLMKLKHNFEYAYYRNISYACVLKMQEHANDKDATEWKKWAALGLKYTAKLLELSYTERV